jgi:hypothetical protein
MADDSINYHPAGATERVNGCETHLFTRLTSKWV